MTSLETSKHLFQPPKFTSNTAFYDSYKDGYDHYYEKTEYNILFFT